MGFHQNSSIHRFIAYRGRADTAHDCVDRLHRKPERLEAMRQNTLLVLVDEVSTASAELLELFDDVACHIRESTDPFGGIQTCFFGDFSQEPPVAKENYHVRYNL